MARTSHLSARGVVFLSVYPGLLMIGWITHDLSQEGKRLGRKLEHLAWLREPWCKGSSSNNGLSWLPAVTVETPRTIQPELEMPMEGRKLTSRWGGEVVILKQENVCIPKQSQQDHNASWWCSGDGCIDHPSTYYCVLYNRVVGWTSGHPRNHVMSLDWNSTCYHQGRSCHSLMWLADKQAKWWWTVGNTTMSG